MESNRRRSQWGVTRSGNLRVIPKICMCGAAVLRFLKCLWSNVIPSINTSFGVTGIRFHFTLGYKNKSQSKWQNKWGDMRSHKPQKMCPLIILTDFARSDFSFHIHNERLRISYVFNWQNKHIAPSLLAKMFKIVWAVYFAILSCRGLFVHQGFFFDDILKTCSYYCLFSIYI